MKGHYVIVFCFIFLLAACGIEADKQFQKSKGEDEMIQQFIQAAEEGETEKVLQFLEEGVAIDTQDKRGRTAVVAATYFNQSETVRALIDAGADVNISDDRKENVLNHAGANGYLDIVKLAVEAGADTTITNRYGGIAIIPAAERGHVEVVDYLLQHSDSDVNHINDLHWTALLEAVILSDGGKAHQDIIKLLLHHGADQTIADKDGLTPLAHAEKKGYTEIIALLK